MNHTVMNSDYMFGNPVFTTRRPASTRLDMLATYVRQELAAIGGHDADKTATAKKALVGMIGDVW